jgi:hypothetical protein
MPIYSVQGPDGRVYDIEGPDKTPDSELIAALEAYLAAKPKPKTGLLADVAGSASNLLNIGRTGIAALTGDANAAAVEGLKREQATQEKYQSGFDPEKITQPWEKGQYLTSAGEAIKQIPSAMASLVPSVGQEMGLATTGRVVGGALAGPIGSKVGQYAVPLIVNAIQALGGQAQEKAQMQAIKDNGLALHDLFESIGSSREMSLAKTKVEEAVMWAVKHLTR